MKKRIKLEVAKQWRVSERKHDGGIMTNAMQAMESPFIDATLTVDDVQYKGILRPYGDIRQHAMHAMRKHPTRFNDLQPPDDARYLLDWAVRNGYERMDDYQSEWNDNTLIDEIIQEFEEDVINSEEFILDKT